VCCDHWAAGTAPRSHPRHHGPFRTPTSTEQVFGNVPIKVDAAAKQVRQLESNAAEFGVELFNMRDARRGIVHVISPEAWGDPTRHDHRLPATATPALTVLLVPWHSESAVPR